MAKNYYVIWEDEQWKVKLEKRSVVSSNHRTQKGAKRKAIQLAKRNNRGITVNAKGGYTRYSVEADEIDQKY